MRDLTKLPAVNRSLERPLETLASDNQAQVAQPLGQLTAVGAKLTAVKSNYHLVAKYLGVPAKKMLRSLTELDLQLAALSGRIEALQAQIVKLGELVDKVSQLTTAKR